VTALASSFSEPLLFDAAVAHVSLNFDWSL
jgi:hypothetical protein